MSNNITADPIKCGEFWRNFQNATDGEMINPFTNRRISITGPTFVRIQSICRPFMMQTLRPSQPSQPSRPSQPSQLSHPSQLSRPVQNLSNRQQRLQNRYNTIINYVLSNNDYADMLTYLTVHAELYREFVEYSAELRNTGNSWPSMFVMTTNISKNIVKAIVKVINFNLDHGDPVDYDGIRMFINDIVTLPTSISNGGFRRSSTIMEAIYDIRHITFLHPQLADNQSSPSKSSISSSNKTSSKSRSKISSNAYNQDHQLLYCIENLNITRHKSFTNKIMKLCKKYKTPIPDKENKLKQIRDKIKNKIEVDNKLKLNLNINTIVPQLYEKRNILKQLLKTKVNCRDAQGKRVGLKITFEGQQGVDASGLSNQFLQSIKDKLCSNNIFIPIPETPSRYTLNYSITDEDIKNTVGVVISKTDFYHFIGSLVFLLFKNEFGFNFQFSRSLLLCMLHKKIEDVEIAFYSHEDNSNLNSLVSTLNFTAEEANMILIPDNTFKDDDDLLKYMIEQSKQQVKYDHDITKAFVKGFHHVSKNLYDLFTSIKITVSQLDNLLKQSDITIEMVNDILIPQLDPLTDSSPAIQKAVYEIIKNKVPYPTEYVKEQNSNMSYPENWNEFIELLLFFWTGKKSIEKQSSNFKYKLKVENTGPRREGIIKAQTCSQLLIIDERIGQDETNFKKRTAMLYENLVSTITETGFNAD